MKDCLIIISCGGDRGGQGGGGGGVGFVKTLLVAEQRPDSACLCPYRLG